MRAAILILLWSIAGTLQALAAADPVRYDISVQIEPRTHTLTVSSQISLPEPRRSLTLLLHAGLKPRFSTEGGEVAVDRLASKGIRAGYRLTLPAGTSQVRVEYAGKIHQDLSSSRAEQSRGFRSTSGLIGEQGVFLAGSSRWYPQIAGYPYLTYSMQVELPTGWSSVSQGTREQRQADGAPPDVGVSPRRHERGTQARPGCGQPLPGRHFRGRQYLDASAGA